MGDVINLRQARKARARADKQAEAARNRAHFGRTKGQKAIEAAERVRMEAVLEGARRDGVADGDEGDPPKG
ncbi:DUF4169 family protein [Edaphosphingomonas haloaromaticamans]|uniref:DUF4169 domain-containing protein n=1 Tax=Edaphosphingomonas haloaromaticamans TaxID=653954 RepID=A0A1S1HFB0_9SPHN|nr:DUF4169 family protein [Sphingomonas haloaromaticamans]OHT20915.1 hypothetical protein BHE75_02919 [Sphingomonas haloaromaticamans]